VVVETGNSRVVAASLDRYEDIDLVTVAHDAMTGEQLWNAQFYGLGQRVNADVMSVEVGPDAVFVTGYAAFSAPDPDNWHPLSFTIAYDLLTGEELWQALYPGQADSFASSSAISPDGTRLFVTGEIVGPPGKHLVDAMIVAYDTSDGDVVWSDSLTDSEKPARPLLGWRIDATEGRVAIVGSRLDNDGRASYTTDILVATWHGSGSNQGELISRVLVPSRGGVPAGIVLAEGGTRAFVTQGADPKISERGCGIQQCPDEYVKDLQHPTDPNRPNYVIEAAGTETVAIDITTGSVLWRSRFKSLTPETPSYTRPWHQQPIDASADGRSVYVAVTSHDLTPPYNGTAIGGRSVLISYDGVTGARQWAVPFGYANLTLAWGPSVSVDPRGGRVVVAGMAYSPEAGPWRGWVVGFDSAGQPEWFRFNPSASGWNGIAHSPDGKRVFVGGWAKDSSGNTGMADDMALSAYDTDALT
jgi:hypothetical protein